MKQAIQSPSDELASLVQHRANLIVHINELRADLALQEYSIIDKIVADPRGFEHILKVDWAKLESLLKIK